MFVTSDIFDLATVGRRRGFQWSENLLCGVAVHSRAWPDYPAVAVFLFEAARLCGIAGELKWAGQGVPTGRSTQYMPPSTFEALASQDAQAPDAPTWLLLKGEREAPGSQTRRITFGGEAFSQIYAIPAADGPLTVVGYPNRPGFAYFIFPYQETPDAKARELLALAAGALAADYGYYFVRDDLCCASGYAMGLSMPLDWSLPNSDEADEIAGWFKYFTSRKFRTEPGPPLLRDLFEVNLLSERHWSASIGGFAHLTSWIAAQPGRGRLQDIGGGRVIWSLTDDEMLSVRPMLDRAGLLKSCGPRVYRGLTQDAAAPVSEP
jgi:hypothetical protein